MPNTALVANIDATNARILEVLSSLREIKYKLFEIREQAQDDGTQDALSDHMLSLGTLIEEVAETQQGVAAIEVEDEELEPIPF